MNPDLVKGPWTKEEDQKVSAGWQRGSTHSGLAVSLSIPVPSNNFRDLCVDVCCVRGQLCSSAGPIVML